MKHKPDSELLRELGAALARRRLDRNLTQADLAREAGVSRATLQRLEAGHSTQLLNLVRVLRTLDLLPWFERLAADADVRPLERLRQERSGRPPRRRARPSSDRDDERPWTWGDER